MRALLTALFLAAVPLAAKADPVVVELYTSQGCEECWRANATLAEIAERPNVLALMLPVDYWDYLGWRDTFAKPEFTKRQQAHRKALKLRALRTPQVVVDGLSHDTGFDRAKVEALIRKHALRPRGAPAVSFTSRGRRAVVSQGRAPTGGAEVWLVRYDPRLQNVRIDEGENRGRVAPHKNVVRELVRLGSWSGRGRTYTIPAAETSGLESALLVQGVRDGRMIAVAVRR